MAVIGKIRQRSGLLIFLIGLSIVGFLIMDATNSQGSVLRGRKDYYGKVNGEKIDMNEYDKRNAENEKAQQDQMRGQSLSEDMQNYVRVRTWNEMVEGIIFGKVYDKLGINVTLDEMKELVSGENVAPEIAGAQIFRNPQTGQFDPAMVTGYLQNLNNPNPQQGVDLDAAKREWANFEKQMKENRFRSKYSSLITKGLYVPTWMGEMNYNEQARNVDFKYVSVSYTDVNDNDIKISDDDLKKYLDEHPGKFKQDEESRRLQYVTFDIRPSSADSAKVFQDMNERVAEFAAGKSVSDDSVFTRLYSTADFDEVYYTSDNLMSTMKDSLLKAPVGTVIGPYIEAGSYKLSKVSARKMVSDSVHIREIKISFDGVAQEAAQARMKFVDSVFTAIDSFKADFGLMAVQYSDDQVSKMRGGDAGWVKQNEKEKPVNDFIFYRAEKGKTYRYPDAKANAWFIFQVVEDRPTKSGVLITGISQKIGVGEQTQQDIASKASAFSADNQTAEKFLAAAKKLNMPVRQADPVRKEDYNLMGLGSARKLVKWTYDAKQGDVSTPITFSDKHVVALLEAVRPKGTPSMDAVRDQLKAEVLKQKKYELLAKKIEDAKAANVDDLAVKLGKPAMTAQGNFANPGVNNAYEPAVVATALATAVGQTSKPIEGVQGVYVVQTLNITEPAKITDFSPYTLQMAQRLQNKAGYAGEVLKKLANIEDDRLEYVAAQ